MCQPDTALSVGDTNISKKKESSSPQGPYFQWGKITHKRKLKQKRKGEGLPVKIQHGSPES